MINFERRFRRLRTKPIEYYDLSLILLSLLTADKDHSKLGKRRFNSSDLITNYQ